MQITTERIKEVARNHFHNGQSEKELQIARIGFEEGANWAIEKLGWIEFSTMSEEGKKKLASTDNSLIQCLFDNGEIKSMDDEHPFATITHICFLPELPCK